MFNASPSQSEGYFSRGVVVAPALELLGIQSPDGGVLPVETLGPGVVEQLGPDGSVRVRWERAGFDTWLDAQDLRSLGADAHLITTQRRDKHGNVRLLSYKVVAAMGLQHNWRVELLPNNVVRTVRSDGACWTFSFNGTFGRIDACWPQPRDDDDAEALTAAELSGH